MTNRILSMLGMIFLTMIMGCVADQSSSTTASNSQSVRCQDCDPSEDVTDTPIDPHSSQAEPAYNLLLSETTEEAISCSWDSGLGPNGGPQTCVVCRGDTLSGCGYHGGGCYYFCRVCGGDTQPGYSTMCGVGSIMR